MPYFAGLRARIVFATLGFLAVHASAGVAAYDFTIKPNLSGLDADVSLAATTDGTLIGNYDATANPTGTRTKPGLLGPFGSTENLPVNVSLGTAITGHPNTRTAGGFRVAADFSTGVLNLSSYTANLLASGPESLTASISLTSETFRTRSPTFLYLGGVPITIPVGQVTLNSLTATQVGDVAPGALTPIGPNRYSFIVAPIVTLAGSIDIFGTQMDLPGTPVPLPLTGEVEFTGDTAHLTSVQPLNLSNSLDPNTMLPQFALDLPTLNPADPAHVLMDLTLHGLSASLMGNLTTDANGILVPEPATAWLLVFGALARRRRH